MNFEKKAVLGSVQRLITLRTVSTAAESLSPVVFLCSQSEPVPGRDGWTRAREAAESRQLIDIEARSAAAMYTPRGAIELLAHDSRTSVVLFLF